MKKKIRVLFAVTTLIGTSIGNQLGGELKGNIAYASSKLINVGERDNKDNNESFKAEFAYEMAQITATIVAAPTTNAENFKVEFSYATAKVTAKVLPIIPSEQRNEFAYEMARISTKIINDPNLNIEKAKAEFAYEIAQITTRIITNGDNTVTVSDPKATLLRNNADIEQKAAARVNNNDTEPKVSVNPAYIAPETYTSLVNEIEHVSDRSNHTDNKVNIDGEVRYHYALNSGSGLFDKNSSGIRARVGFDIAVNQDWRAYGMLEGEKKLVNYNDEFKLSRLYVAGKMGESMVTAGSFGYLMADGNIYDSGFKGVRVDFGEPIKYTLSYGDTDNTKKTFIATARHNDFDYNLEAGVYHYQKDDAAANNTIWTLGGNYNFSNFGLGAMALGSSEKDSKGDSTGTGYVLSFNYGDLKTWRKGTYGVFAKYYNQPLGTYIEHGMNGTGGAMQGFKGYGLGVNYTLRENVVTGIEYYGLTDKTTGEKGDTWWSQITHYF